MVATDVASRGIGMITTNPPPLLLPLLLFSMFRESVTRIDVV